MATLDAPSTQADTAAMPRDGRDVLPDGALPWHLAAIVECSLDAVVGQDLNGIVTSWNAGAETIFGYPARDMIGQPIARLMPTDLLHEEDALLNRLLRGERVERLDTQRQTRDGQVIDVSVTLSPIRDAGGRIVGASKFARDITALKRAEREAARLSRLYAALSQVNQAIVWAPDRDDLFRKVCRVLVEHGGLRMAWIGWNDPHTHRLMPVAEFGDTHGYLPSLEIYSDERPQGQGPSGKAYRSGQPQLCNDLFADPTTVPWRPNLGRSGFLSCAAFPIKAQGTVCGTLNVYSERRDFFHDKEVALLAEAAVDISFALDNFARDAARRQAEQTLRNEVLFSDTMLESMPGIVYFYDTAGRFLRWNRNFEAVSGYSGSEIAAMHPLDFFLPGEQDLLKQRIAAVFSTGESSVEADFVSRDGHTTPYFFTGRRVQFQDKTCLVGIGIDISERKRMEAEREKRHRAEAADRIKSSFLATMSHELRTPLNAIIGFTGILLKGLAGPVNPEQGNQLGMVQASARHLLALVNDVLDISKIEAGQLDVARERFDLRQSIDTVIALVAPQAQAKALALRTQVAAGLGEAMGDQRRFEQILLNLLSNAVKFTDRGEVALAVQWVADTAAPGVPPGPARIFVQVSDSGIGIRAEDLPTLFQPFRQIDSGLARHHEGTGLGLAICHRLATLMGGDIRAESEWGRGSTFSVTLPLQGHEPIPPVRTDG